MMLMPIELSNVYVDVSAKDKGKGIATDEDIPTQIRTTPIDDNMEIDKGFKEVASPPIASVIQLSNEHVLPSSLIPLFDCFHRVGINREP
ncbi:hypothetical protein L1987_20090 [Smallanthus sonchifolius]|uniref:Uncharacterized protein n=1 Tax=Smallanthus sonchifolius TaxID=185202 RepID=A0ACB9ISJ8_9ASTR|nr:hypothetical protein L1987_20090 [Smallanthus sonchifolius]